MEVIVETAEIAVLYFDDTKDAEDIYEDLIIHFPNRVSLEDTAVILQIWRVALEDSVMILQIWRVALEDTAVILQIWRVVAMTREEI